MSIYFFILAMIFGIIALFIIFGSIAITPWFFISLSFLCIFLGYLTDD